MMEEAADQLLPYQSDLKRTTYPTITCVFKRSEKIKQAYSTVVTFKKSVFPWSER